MEFKVLPMDVARFPVYVEQLSFHSSNRAGQDYRDDGFSPPVRIAVLD
jgi:hypothetical protein